MKNFLAENLVVSWLNVQPEILALKLFAFAAVPARRPSRFISVERTGGARRAYCDSPTLAVQCWAESAGAAGDLADLVAQLLAERLPFDPHVRSVTVTGISNFPLDETAPRAQVVVEMILQ